MKNIRFLLAVTFFVVSSVFSQTGWKERTGITTKTLRDVRIDTAFYLPTYSTDYNVFIAGDSGTVLFRNYSEDNWHQGNTNTTANLHSIVFPYNDTGFAVGEQGTIIRSNDKGANWFSLVSPTWATLFDIGGIDVTESPNPKLGWIAGDSGNCFRTINKMNTWTKMNIQTNAILRAVKNINISITWICGDSGNIFKTSSTGTNWTKHTIPRSVDLYSIEFVNVSDGWIVGAGGTILHTQNGGAIWELQNSGVTVTLRSCTFLSNTVGYVAGDSGVILKTTNGGTTWKKLESGTTKTLHSIAFFNEMEGIVVGENGTILETSVGGEAIPIMTISHRNIDFGTISLGKKKTSIITITNNGVVPLYVPPLQINSEVFTVASLDSTNDSLPTGSSRNYKVTFEPSTVNFYAGKITIDDETSIGLFGSANDSIITTKWSYQYPQPSTNILRGVECIDSLHAIAVGGYGTIIRTSDGGKHWNVLHNAGSNKNFLYRVKFYDATIGIAVGDYGTILKTTNSGSEWYQVESNTHLNLLSITNTDIMKWYAVGYDYLDNVGVFLFSNNQGETWTVQNLKKNYLSTDVSFPDEQNGYIICFEGKILKTTNGGVTWSEVHRSLGQYFMKVIFFDSLSGIITGGNGVIKKTSNGGMTWTLIPNNVGDAFYDMKFRDANNGFIVGVSGRILRTSNGGNSWSIVTTFPYSLYGISMIGNFVSVVGSSPGLSYNAHGVSLSSTDTGATWTDDTKFIIRRNFRDVAFTNSQVGSIVGDSGTIFRTTDGGTTWDKQLHGTIFESSGKHFHSVSFINPNIGTVVGDIGTIVKTTNSGTNWILQNSNTTKMLNDVSLFDENKCVVVGEQGLILQTNDGGETWNRRTGETVNELRGVTYVTQSVVVCVGSNGTIVKSSDGGLNWRIISTPTPSTLNDVRFFDEVVGIAVGNNGVILRTTDSGESWLKIDRRAYENLHSITSTGSTGILTGSYGTILRTTDKGETWSNLSIGTLQELRAVTFSDQQSIVIVGTNGLVLSTSEGVVGVGNLSSSNNRPEHFELMQNYPNPFNPLTVIRYQLPVTSHVALKIYNILGQEVAQLVNEILQPGKYQRTWNAKDVASGIYYYKLSANVSSPDMSGLEQSFVEVKKMLYIR